MVVYKRRRGIHVQRSDGSCQPLQLLQSSLIAFTAATVGRASSTSPKRTDPTEIEPSDGGEKRNCFLLLSYHHLPHSVVLLLLLSVAQFPVAELRRAKGPSRFWPRRKKGGGGSRKKQEEPAPNQPVERYAVIIILLRYKAGRDNVGHGIYLVKSRRSQDVSGRLSCCALP